MTTNEIELQLKRKAEQQIREHVKTIIDNMAEFSREHTNINRSGLRWFSNRSKPEPRFNGDDDRPDPFDHFDWNELAQLMRRNMEHNLLQTMVEKKTKELLNKMDLFE
tara:strand:- start:81 stop:404 length:324 start_codon:yes stop_codon:yes gene_type:complete